MTVTAAEQLKASLSKALLASADAILFDLGWVKDRDEIDSIAQAAEIGDIALERVLNILRPGVREREIAAELEYQMAMMGSEKPAFETIVASGHRSALPHGVASSKRIKKGDLVTFDFGATVDGHVILVKDPAKVGQFQMASKRGSLTGDTLHQAAFAA